MELEIVCRANLRRGEGEPLGSPTKNIVGPVRRQISKHTSE